MSTYLSDLDLLQELYSNCDSFCTLDDVRLAVDLGIRVFYKKKNYRVRKDYHTHKYLIVENFTTIAYINDKKPWYFFSKGVDPEA